MNGPEHYLEAEKLLALADSEPSENWSHSTGEHKADVIAAAQVHATLALVAVSEGAYRSADAYGWEQATEPTNPRPERGGGGF